MRLPNAVIRYALALAISVTAILLQKLFWDYLNPLVWILMYPAVFFASLAGGLGPGLFATFFCAAAALSLFWTSQPGFNWSGQTVFQVLVFIVMGMVYSLFNNHLRNIRQRLARSLAVRDEFLSIASHELKTPITTLVLQMEIGRMKIQQQAPHLWATLEKYFDKSKDQADKLVALIDELLNVTRITSGRMALQIERFDLSFLVGEVVERFAVPFHISGIPLAYNRPEPIWICADRNKTAQVLTNLLSNAQKYGEARPVTVRVEKAGDTARIEVEDQGIGIPPEKQDRIFERFERAVSARNISGLGLGLFISKSIVDQHGGRISVRSQVGRGTTFTVQLPLESPSG